MLKDFTTRKVLDTQVTSKKNFQFHFQPLQSTGVPCAVSVTWGEQTDMADVKNAPTNCSPTPATLTGSFSAENASWVIDDGDLLITYFDGATQRLRILDQLDKEYGVFHEVTVGDRRFVETGGLVI